MNILDLIDRKTELFSTDLLQYDTVLDEMVRSSRFLVIGAAGSIGQSVSKEIFQRNPKCLHVVDVSENNLVELVRQLRSTTGYIDGDFQSYVMDCGSEEYAALMHDNNAYDYVLNLSALKHVRSEKDPYSLMRMVRVNILNTINTLKYAQQTGVKKIFLCFH